MGYALFMSVSFILKVNKRTKKLTMSNNEKFHREG
jgi:hypothetical protein